MKSFSPLVAFEKAPFWEDNAVESFKTGLAEISVLTFFEEAEAMVGQLRGAPGWRSRFQRPLAGPGINQPPSGNQAGGRGYPGRN